MAYFVLLLFNWGYLLSFHYFTLRESKQIKCMDNVNRQPKPALPKKIKTWKHSVLHFKALFYALKLVLKHTFKCNLLNMCNWSVVKEIFYSSQSACHHCGFECSFYSFACEKHGKKKTMEIFHNFLIIFNFILTEMAKRLQDIFLLLYF